MDVLTATLQEFGADAEALVRLDEDGPDVLPYATLLTGRQSGDCDLLAVIGVYEWQNRPLMVVADGAKLGDGTESIRRLRRLVAMRGDAPYLGVVYPGSLTVFTIGLDDYDPASVEVDTSIPLPLRKLTLSYLGNQRPQPRPVRWISDVVLRLLTESITRLQVEAGLSDGDAISLVGRALFVRFLADRELIHKGTFGTQEPVEGLFDDLESTKRTCEWLDHTFNGDFLPLSDELLNVIPARCLGCLGDILRKAPGGQLHLPWEEKWDRLDFAHIQVGVLSQAYERYLNRFNEEQQKKEGGYYTPRHIADLMVSAAFAALRREGSAADAIVLDPAAGAGVFLITAFRRLIGERWISDGVRPDTKVLRDILYSQIRGFDINEAAIRFAALGLYLASIELDPNPEPVEKLRFNNLRGVVLQRFEGAGAPAEVDELGSLGDQVPVHHRGKYDLVIGNPPWASSTKLRGWKALKAAVKDVASRRLLDPTITAPLPNEVLDLPFVWRAMQWARPGGQIAFAMHARILFQQGETMPAARAALFTALTVTSVVNGTELRRTNVWPEITAPFCLIFAVNAVPPPGASFRFINTRIETSLNRSGSWRVDPSSAEALSNALVRERPELLKILFRGSRLDLEAFDRLTAKGYPTLDSYWKELFGESEGRPAATGNGYQKLRRSSHRHRLDGEPGVSAGALRGLPELTAGGSLPFLVDPASLPPFTAERVHRIRNPEIYRGPILLLKESPSVRLGRLEAFVSDGDLVFNQSYHGFSARSHPNGKLLVRYLAVVLTSRLAMWLALITSGRFGFERDVVEKFIIERTPIRPLDTLSAADVANVCAVFERVSREQSEAALYELDAFVVGLFGLQDRDLQVIDDTLSYAMPTTEGQRRAEAPPTAEMIEGFRTTLIRELASWTKRFSAEPMVFAELSPGPSPWRFVGLCNSGQVPKVIDPILAFVDIADQSASSEIIVVDDAAHVMWIGRLDQARYWTNTQAKLLARRLLWERSAFFAEAHSRRAKSRA